MMSLRSGVFPLISVVSLGLIVALAGKVQAQGSQPQSYDKFKPSDYPIDLTEETFADVVKNSQWMVLCFAPWCGHCKKFLPIWREYAKQIYPKYKTASVDW